MNHASRITYVALALATIAIGLMVHQYGGSLNASSRDVLGDILWASMIAWWIGAIAPGMQLRARSVLAIVVCFLVEFSQLYHSPSVDSIRTTTIGQLTLGSGFDARDLVAYTIGVLFAVVIERSWRTGHRD